ncbi:MAG TPA: metallophosphoesterase [Candidatus Binatia bacterium]|nr:metallophosphoesterase [Candidatus Binatia bacterium]
MSRARVALAAALVAGAAVAAPPAARVVVFGDFGAATAQRDAVAQALVAAQRRVPADLAIAVGDNLYDCGADAALAGAGACAFAADGATVDPGYAAPPDPRFDRLFEEPLRALVRPDGSPLPVYLALGNHDVASSAACGAASPAQARTKACLEVAHRGAHWRMPGRHYVVDVGPATFVVFDSNLLALGDYGGFSFDAEVTFLHAALAGCERRPCFLVSHHPPVTAGHHAAQVAAAAYQSRARRIEQAGRFVAWLAGHDHDLQHLRAARGYDVFVSGNGARARTEDLRGPSDASARLLFDSDAPGFAVLEVRAEDWSVRLEDAGGHALACCAARGGPCEPRPCD